MSESIGQQGPVRFAIVVLLTLLGSSWGPRAAADTSLPAFPTPGQIHRAEEDRQAETIATALRALPGVARVEVQVSLPDQARRALDRPAGAPSAVVSLAIPAASTSDVGSAAPATSVADVRRLAAAALPGLEPEAVQVVISRAPAEPATPTAPLAQLGPFGVARESLPALRLLLIATLLANALLSLLLIARVRRGRRREGAS